VDELEVRTVVYVSPGRAFEFLLDFPGYADYTEYVTAVHQDGDGGPGTTYDLDLSWWKLSYTATSEVTEIAPPPDDEASDGDWPAFIKWRLAGSVRMAGYWAVEPVDPPDEEAVATEVRFLARYDPDSFGAGTLGLPQVVSSGWLLQKALPLAKRELRGVVEDVVADLEGERRPVELDVLARPSALAEE
jgi:hypothetical protein